MTENKKEEVKYIIELTEQESILLTKILDIALRHEGLVLARECIYFANKIEKSKV